MNTSTIQHTIAELEKYYAAHPEEAYWIVPELSYFNGVLEMERKESHG